MNDPDFENAVGKRQTGNAVQLASAEKRVVKRLLKSFKIPRNECESEPLIMEQEFAELRRTSTEDMIYIDFSFHLGSMEEVELFWRFYEYILAAHRRELSLQPFETPVFSTD